MIQAQTIIGYAVAIKEYCATHTCKKCAFSNKTETLANYCRLIKVMPEDWPVEEKRLTRSRQKRWQKEECSRKASS